MRLGSFLRKNVDHLPLFNRRNGSKSYITRKQIFIGLFILVLLILLLSPSGSSKPKRKIPKNRYDKYYNAREDLFNTRLFHIKSVAALCFTLDPNTTFWDQSISRFSALGMEENADLEHKYYFAILLKNSADHFPTVVDNLIRVIHHVGEHNVFVSIYEGGSTDEGHTAAMVETFKTTMEAIGIEHHIEINANEPNPHNAVLKPLKAMYRNGKRVFNTLVMMNDDLWCSEELLELLYQSRRLSAAVTCSTDVRSKNDIYSLSPGHDINGRLFQEGKISSYILDDASSARFKHNYPFRVLSCFSSVTVLDPTPFYPPFDFSFTSQHASQSDHSRSPWENECGFSPELDLALRYAAIGMGHEMLVPRTQTANHLLEFFKSHRTQTELKERELLHRRLGVWVEEDTGGKENPFATDYVAHENDDVFKVSAQTAEKFQCNGAGGIKWMKLTMPHTFKGDLVIHRELPVLEDS